MHRAAPLRELSENAFALKRLPYSIFWGTFLGAAILFTAGQVAIDQVNGWWIDELYALWASDKTTNFSKLFADRIAFDTNPPLYFSLLHFARLIVDNDRLAVILLNLLFLAIAGVVVFGSARRANYEKLSLVGLSAFLLSGPVMRYASEARAYFLSLMIAFVAAWFTAIAIKSPRSSPSLAAYMCVGVLAGITHLYAALLCCCLAAGLILLSIIDGRRDLMRTGLALGVSSGLVTSIWAVLLMIVVATGDQGHLGWMTLNWETLYAAYWEAKSLAVGSKAASLFFVAFALVLVITPCTRNLVIVFGTALVLFILIPLAVSMKMPIVSGKYWAIGAPVIIPLVCFAAAEWLEAKGRLSSLGVGLAVCVLIASSVTGFFTGRFFVAQKPSWWGGELVRASANQCGPGSIHIYNAPVGAIRDFRWGFAKTSGLPEDVFVDVTGPADGTIESSRTGSCNILGWAEHVLPLVGSDDELMRRLQIEPSEGTKVVRHSSGYVVLKKGAL